MASLPAVVVAWRRAMREARMFATPPNIDVEAIARTNPKGRLLELCARAKCKQPKVQRLRRGTIHGIAMQIVLYGREFACPMQWAVTRTLAEHLAAHMLLEQLVAAQDEGDPSEWVSDDEGARLHQANAKGALYQRCERLGLDRPKFDVQVIATREGSAYEACAYVVLPNGEELWGDVRRSRASIVAENAVAEVLLTHLQELGLPEVDLDGERTRG